MTLRSGAKFKEKSTCGFKYVTQPIISLKISFQWALFVQSKQDLSYKNAEELSFMTWGIGLTFIRALKGLKNCTLMGSFCPKHIMFQLEHFRGIMCHNTEGWCNI